MVSTFDALQAAVNELNRNLEGTKRYCILREIKKHPLLKGYNTYTTAIYLVDKEDPSYKKEIIITKSTVHELESPKPQEDSNIMCLSILVNKLLKGGFSNGVQ